MGIIEIIVALFIAIPAVATPYAAATGQLDELCELAEGKYDPAYLGSCPGGTWDKVYMKVLPLPKTSK